MIATATNNGKGGGQTEILHPRIRRKALGDFCRNALRNKAAMGEYAGAAGGYLIPIQLQLGIDEKLRERKLFHKRAFRLGMATKECWCPSFDLTAAHATGASPIFGGLNPTWTTPEGSTLPESEPAFAGGKLVTRDLECYVIASNQLVDDGGEALGAYLEHQFYKALAWAVERACFVGDGATAPHGVVSSPATKVVTRATTVTITQVDIAKMVGSLIPACFCDAVWACSLSALEKIAALSAYEVNQNFNECDPCLCGTLFTRPLYVTENLPVVGTQGDLMLFDPTMYVLGERHVEVTASPHPLFRSYQTVFRLWWRGDGKFLPNGIATLADGTTTAGVSVALETK